MLQDPDLGYSLGCPALCKNSLVKDPHHLKLLGKYQVSAKNNQLHFHYRFLTLGFGFGLANLL